jgi:hypothetical protein
MSLKDIAILAALRTFAAGKRWQVHCGVCGETAVAVDVTELGKALHAHAHRGDVSITVKTGARMGP